jgi:hypothetical protein
MPATTLTDRALIRLSGEDVRGFLQGLVTNDVTGTLPVWAALLTPQGKCLFDFLVWADGDDLLIDCERAAAGDLAKRLTLYRLRRKISIEREAELCVHWCPPAEAGARPQDALDTPASEENATIGDGALPLLGNSMFDPRLPALGHRWLAPASSAAADDAWRAHRLSLGVTEGVAELGNGETLWLECNAAELNGVSFTKGCYVGQENTARMNWRSTVNRRMAVVPLADADARRQRIAYPALGLSVEHRRVEDMAGQGWRDWMGERG